MIEVGQKVYVKTLNDRARYGVKIYEDVVTKIGKKYFYLQGFTREKFSLATMIEESIYSPDYQVYLTRQEIEDEIEFNKLYQKLRDSFSWNNSKNLSLDQLRRIIQIVEEGKNHD